MHNTNHLQYTMQEKDTVFGVDPQSLVTKEMFVNSPQMKI